MYRASWQKVFDNKTQKVRHKRCRYFEYKHRCLAEKYFFSKSYAVATQGSWQCEHWEGPPSIWRVLTNDSIKIFNFDRRSEASSTNIWRIHLGRIGKVLITENCLLIQQSNSCIRTVGSGPKTFFCFSPKMKKKKKDAQSISRLQSSQIKGRSHSLCYCFVSLRRERQELQCDGCVCCQKTDVLTFLVYSCTHYSVNLKCDTFC